MAPTQNLRTDSPQDRQRRIVDSLLDAFSDLISANPSAFRRKFRKMAADPFAFYRGSACVFYADVAQQEDRWADERTSRVWIQGDLHAENFGTHMNGDGVLVFDVNDFDEAYVGHFTWDIRRFAASTALLGFRKAFSDSTIEEMIRTYARSYLAQVRRFAETDHDHEFGLTLASTDGLLHDVLQTTRLRTRVDLLDAITEVNDYEREFRDAPGTRRLEPAERTAVEEAFHAYTETIPSGRRTVRDSSFVVKDVVGRTGFGIGSAGLPAYNVLIEGNTQALENDVILSIKQGNVAAPSRVVTDASIRDYFRHSGHRTAVSQRALQAAADPWLGWCELDGVGQVVQELSPYSADIDWDQLTEPDEILPLLESLGQATAKVHCVSDADSEQTLVDFQTEEAIVAAVGDRDEEFVGDLVEFGTSYGELVRDDYRLFVDAFRNGMIPGVGEV
ncbi:MAG TPA: DUF2252 domain-containing protein [Segeticoccus sp.]|nr:DUF2252 domain-containing protein [Segeticoccus sp.]